MNSSKDFLQDLRPHRTRAFLTIVAITWGTIAVVLLLSFGEGLGQSDAERPAERGEPDHDSLRRRDGDAVRGDAEGEEDPDGGGGRRDAEDRHPGDQAIRPVRRWRLVQFFVLLFPRLVGEGLGAPPRRLLDGHRHPGALPAGELGHPRGAGRDAGRADRAGLLVGAGAEIAAGADRRAPRGRLSGCRSAPGREVRESVLLDGCSVGAGARVDGSILAPGVRSAPGPSWPTPSSAGMKESRPEAMIDDVLGMPDQLRDALWRIESARLEPAEAAGLIVCGMGGSAIGGDLAAAALGDRLTQAARSSSAATALPSWATPDWAVFCSSYSGNTEETLACYAAAEAVGAHADRRHHRRLARRGRAPRRRAGDRAARRSPAARRRRLHVRDRGRGRGARRRRRPRSGPRSTAAAAFLEAQRSVAAATAVEIADAIDGRVPVVYGGGLTVPVAYRWKCQINENAKLPCFSHRDSRDRPQRDRRLGGRSPTAPRGVLLDDGDQHPRERQRFELTAELVAPEAASVVTDRDRGRDPDRAPALGGDARRPALARARRAARGRPDSGRRDRVAQGPPRAAVRAMVMARGLGTRLRPITCEMPKPMVPVLNRPVVEQLVAPARPPRLRRGDRQPALVPGARSRAASATARSSASAHLQREEGLLGTAGGVRNVCRLPRRGSISSSSPATRSPTST